MSVFKKRLAVLLPLLLVAALGLAACGGGGSNQPVEVKVNLTEFKIEPATTTFKVGTPYHFVVTNSGTVPHEMDIAPMPAAGTTPQAEETGEVEPLASIEQDQLPAGATATLDYTFTQAGTFQLACHLPGHYEGGMHTTITVTP